VGARASSSSPESESSKGATLPDKPSHQSIPKDSTLNSLPREWPEDPLIEIHRAEKEGKAKVLIVLDDDATGTQTVNGVTVLTDW
jgi:hypothetical protein